jgi:hypothetical protein
MEKEMTTLPFTEDDVWLIASAAANLRSAPGDDPKEQERRIEAAWRIAPKLDDLMRRMLAAIKEQEGEKPE